MQKKLLVLAGLFILRPSPARADSDTPTPPASEAPLIHKAGERTSDYIPPRYVPYEGGDIPEGARITTRPDVAYIATGTSIFGGAYLTSLIYGLATCGAQTNCRAGSGWLYLPLAGPFVASAQAPTTGGQALAAFDGGVQVLGVALTVVGFAMPRKFVTWQSKTATFTVTPAVGSVGGPLEPGKPDLRSGLSLTLSNL